MDELELERPEGVSAEPREEELALAKDVLKSFTKTVKTLQVYPESNPLSQKFIDDISNKFTAFTETYGDLKLAVEQFSLSYKGKEVFYSEERTDNMALYLFLDGIREFSFHQGISRDEIALFLNIFMSSQKQENPEDDIVTLLWEQELEHIGYFVPEDVSDDENAEDEFLSGSSESGQTVEGATYSDLTIVPAGLEIEVEPFSDDEAKSLKSELAITDSDHLLDYICRTLLELMPAEEDISDFAAFAKGISSLFDFWMDRKKPAAITEVLVRLAGLMESADPHRKEIIGKVFSRISTAGAIGWFVSNCKAREDLHKYIKLVGPHAIESLVEILGESEDRTLRRFICTVLGEIAAEAPERFGKYVEDERWFLVRNIVMILGLGKNKTALPFIEKALKNPEVRVRRECIKTLDSIGGEQVKKSLVFLLNDPDSTTRTYALKALRRSGGPELFGTIAEHLKKEDFKKRPFPEKREFLEAYGASGGPEALPLLEGFYKKKGLLFGKDENLELRAAAAYGMAHVPVDRVKDLLKKGAESRKSLLKEACIASLKTAGLN